MATADLLPTIPCPSCRQPMQTQDFEQNYRGSVRVEFCLACAVEKAMKLWSDADHRRHLGPTPQALGDALQRIQFPHPPVAPSRDANFGDLLLAGTAAGMGLDLVSLGIHAIGRLFDGIR
jgi:hypothetical protein